MVREIKITQTIDEKQAASNTMLSIYFGGSLTRNLNAKQTEVRLTKFNPLENYNQAHNVMQQVNQNPRDFKSLSASNLLFQKQKADEFGGTNRKRHWYGKSSINTVLGRGRSIRSIQQQETSNHEPFQVVWRHLSFEVEQSNYDKLLGSLMGRRSGNNFCPIDLSSSCTNQDENETSKSFGDLNNKRRGQKRVIFENLNGYVKSGEISAILGPSGSGKTSLLNAICGRTGSNYRGSIQLVGRQRERRMRLSIIPQKDYLMENLTVKENLSFSSKILNTSKAFDHDANVMRVVKMLNLTNCLHSSTSNISGGEYKRVSIAQELLIQPDILILDEPTSGLDSLNCKNLIKSLGQLIEASRVGTIKPIAIVMTIHQPDVDIFQMFDHVYCMARHGRVIFDGHPSEALDRIKSDSGLKLDELDFSSLSSSRQSRFSTNPANLLIEIASEDLYGQEPINQLSLIQLQQFEEYYQRNCCANNYLYHSSIESLAFEMESKSEQQSNYSKSSYNNNLLSNVRNGKGGSLELNSSYLPQQANKEDHHLVRDKRLNAKTDHSGQFWHHTSILMRRAFTSTLRDPLMTLTSLAFHLFVPFIFWTVYSERTGSVGACPLIQRDMDMVSMVSNNTMGKMEEMQEELSLAVECSTMFFLSTYSFSMCSLSIAALAFPLNMHILLKEVRNGWYNLPSYVVAKTIATFPFEVLFPVISLVMIYLMLDMPGSYMGWRLWAIAFIMALISMISHTQGLIFGALCMDSVQTAIFLASSSTLPQTLLSGFTARIRHMPLILQKLSWLSLYRYSCDAINIIRFGYGICPCDGSTDEYLRTKQTSFTDIPSQMKPLFTYYLTNVADDDPTSNQFINETYLTNTTNMNNASYIKREESYLQIPGISYDLTLNSTARGEMIKMIENNELDLFGRMADMMARSFTFGRAIDNCDSVRSELLTTSGAPKDEYLPYLIGGMLGLLVACKLILFVIVKFKIGSRI